MESKTFKLQQYILPNDKILEINSNVISTLTRYQTKHMDKEQGGILIGLTSNKGNILIKRITIPYPEDKMTYITFKRKSKKHIHILKREYESSNGILNYLGNWHTHPQKNPSPSSIDLKTWNESLRQEKSVSNYLFFIIVGLSQIKVWSGNLITQNISELKRR